MQSKQLLNVAHSHGDRHPAHQLPGQTFVSPIYHNDKQCPVRYKSEWHWHVPKRNPCPRRIPLPWTKQLHPVHRYSHVQLIPLQHALHCRSDADCFPGTSCHRQCGTASNPVPDRQCSSAAQMQPAHPDALWHRNAHNDRHFLLQMPVHVQQYLPPDRHLPASQCLPGTAVSTALPKKLQTFQSDCRHHWHKTPAVRHSLSMPESQPGYLPVRRLLHCRHASDQSDWQKRIPLGHAFQRPCWSFHMRPVPSGHSAEHRKTSFCAGRNSKSQGQQFQPDQTSCLPGAVPPPAAVQSDVVPFGTLLRWP